MLDVSLHYTESVNARTLPVVDPMMVRRFVPRVTLSGFIGGVWVMDEYDVEEIGLADARLDYDEAQVDCSQRIFQLTTEMLFLDGPLALTAFPSRRWRNLRQGEHILGTPNADHPLLYIGNPVRCIRGEDGGISVVGRGEFVIKSGMELGY